MKTYRAGIIGLGRMGSTMDPEIAGSPSFRPPMTIAGSCVASDRLELVCGADLLPEKREAFRERWGVAAVYEDFRRMVEQERPDLVAICTRAEPHAELGIAVAELGVPMVYMEKAIACSMVEADALRDACLSHGTCFNSGVLWRFDDRSWWARDLIARGAIGEPRAVVQYSGGGLMHCGIHVADKMMYFLGDPRALSVRGELQPHDLRIEGNRVTDDPSASFEVEFEGGATGYSIACGRWDWDIFGSEGVLRCRDNGAEWTLERSGANLGDGKAPTPPPDFRSSSVNCLEDLVGAYETGRPTLNHIEQAHHATEICLAVAESHRQGGARVKLPLGNRGLYVWHV
jgi:predicted dehydrogenase